MFFGLGLAFRLQKPTGMCSGIVLQMRRSLAALNRRRFLAGAGLALAGPNLLLRAHGADGNRPPPSERITVGIVGWGMQGPMNTANLLKLPDCQVVAACDIERSRLQAAADTINAQYGNRDCRTYHDYRELMARKDIDAVMLAVPDHWHAMMSVEAAKQGKDVYGEKPLAHTIAEQQAIVKAVQTNNRIWQAGSWQRSERHFHYAAEIARNGLLGKITRVEIGLPAGHYDFLGLGADLLHKLAELPEKIGNLANVVSGSRAWELAVTPPPEGFDYETWIGPARMEPYISARVYQNWRWNYNTGGGQLIDWVGHHCDIAHWGLGNDDKIAPLEVEGQGDFPPANAIWNTCTRYRVTAKYPNDLTMIIAGGHDDIRSGVRWIGTGGWAWVDRDNAFEASNKEWENARSLPEELRQVKLIHTGIEPGHHRNFLDSVKSRKPTVAPVEVAHHSTIPGHLGLIAMRVGRKIKWDPVKEEIVGDSEASKLLSRPYRAPWKLA